MFVDRFRREGDFFKPERFGFIFVFLISILCFLTSIGLNLPEEINVKGFLNEFGLFREGIPRFFVFFHGWMVLGSAIGLFNFHRNLDGVGFVERNRYVPDGFGPYETILIMQGVIAVWTFVGLSPLVIFAIK